VEKPGNARAPTATCKGIVRGCRGWVCAGATVGALWSVCGMSAPRLPENVRLRDDNRSSFPGPVILAPLVIGPSAAPGAVPSHVAQPGNATGDTASGPQWPTVWSLGAGVFLPSSDVSISVVVPGRATPPLASTGPVSPVLSASTATIAAISSAKLVWTPAQQTTALAPVFLTAPARSAADAGGFSIVNILFFARLAGAADAVVLSVPAVTQIPLTVASSCVPVAPERILPVQTLGAVALAANTERALTADPCALEMPAHVSSAVSAVGIMLPAPAQPMERAIRLTTLSRNASLLPALVKPVVPRNSTDGAGPGLKAVTVEVRQLLCSPSVIDPLLSANYREEMRALSAAGKREELKAKALRFLTVIAAPAEQRHAFGVLMDASLASAMKTDVRMRVGAFLASFPEDSDLRRAALLFAASWCYDKEKYDLALEKVAELKALPDNTLEMQAGALMTEGLCRVRQNDSPGAQAIFAGIVKDYGKTALAPKAQFLIGWMHMSNQDNRKARVALRQVVKDYPNTEYAIRAQRLLDSLASAR
jgi:TolA-binding protein